MALCRWDGRANDLLVRLSGQRRIRERLANRAASTAVYITAGQI